MAAHISELLVDAHFGDNNTTQMIELRGEPNESLDQGTYLVVVGEDGFDPGVVHGIFDLSGQTLGSNGYLAILQADSPHIVDPASSVLQSTEEAFGGLPGDIYSDSHNLSDRIDFIIGANAYMLIQTEIAPTLELDIDTDNDGTIDPLVASAWTVLDSISLHPFVGRGDVAYGGIVFAEIGATDPEIVVGEGVAMIPTEGFGYAGRVGESTGSDPLDWIAGTVQDENRADQDAPPRWALVDNLFGTPSQYEFSGRDLDHVGGPNFVGGAKGTVFNNTTREPVEGATVFADSNGNGIRDALTFTVNPDDLVDPDDLLDENGREREYPLLNAFPGVTVTNFALGSFAASEVTGEQEDDFPNTRENRIFAKGGIDWFTKQGTLRFDFYDPIRSASIVAIGSDNSLSKVYGRLDAFNADGELLDTAVSGLLIDSARQAISVSSSGDDIAYLMAYSDEEVNEEDGGPFGRFDELVYTQLETGTTTDADGNYVLGNLFPGSYQLSVLGGDLIGEGVAITVEKYEHFNQDFSLGANQAPTLQDAEFDLAENSSEGVVVGTVTASDNEGQEITYTLADSSDAGFQIDSVSGEITLAAGTLIDFESVTNYSLSVVVTDSLGASTQAAITINVTDVNETPVANDATLTVAESATVGTVVGSLTSSDPDTGQTLTYTIVGGTGGERFNVDSATGAITLASELNFEDSASWTLEIEVADDGDPSQSTTANVLIQIEDENESPVITPGDAWSVPEESVAGTIVGMVTASDSDLNQTLTYQISGGTGETLFEIDGSTGEVSVGPAAVLDFENQTQYTLLVTVFDNGSPIASASQEFTVDISDVIEDVNDPPVITVGDAWSIPEDAVAGVAVGTVSASDPDEGQNLSYEISGGTGASWFEINPNTGEVTVSESAEFDFETDTTWTLEVTVSDDGDPVESVSQQYTINVTDVNEAPVFLASVDQANAMVGERFEMSLPTDLIADPDGETQWVLSASSGEDGLPEWLEFDVDTLSLTGLPRSISVGVLTIDLHVADAVDADLFSVISFTIGVESGETPLQNKIRPQDVNGDNNVTANDALRIINFLAIITPGTLFGAETRLSAFFDVSGDNLVTALDALQVINEMARVSTTGGVGEQVGWQPAVASSVDHSDQDEGLLAYVNDPQLF